MPPVAEAVACATACPKQRGDDCVTLATTGAVGWLMVVVIVAVQLFSSVTVVVYVFADREVAVALVCVGVVSHWYV